MKTSIKKMKLADLIPTENNPRQIKKDDFERLKKSIKSFPEMLDIREIVVDENNRILGGHQRVKALLANGEKEVNVKVVEGLSEEEKREFVIRDNIQNGEWDFDVLANEWSDLDLQDWGIELPIADIEEEIVEDEAPEPPAEPKSKLGEIYQLGEHRLMCGDATDAEQVAKLMNGQKADMVFTDPPYSMHLDTDFSSMRSRLNTDFAKRGMKGGKYSAVIGDNDDFTPELIRTIFDNFGYCKETIIWGADYFAELIPNRNDGSWFVWDKRQNEDDALDNTMKMDKQFGSCFELCWSKNRHKREIARIKWAGLFGMEKDDTKKRIHPTQKPSILAEWFVERYCEGGGLVVDIYGGSGSTLIACEQLGRKCYMMELDPHYVDVIIERWENLTGKKAERIQ